MDRYHARRQRLRKQLRAAQVESLLVTNFTNVTYLTGFSGDDSYLLVNPSDEVLITDPRYTEQLSVECPDLRLVVRKPGTSMIDGIVRACQAAKIRRLGIESESMTVGLRDRIADRIPRVDIVPLEPLVERQRSIKDAQEVAAIRRAIAVAESAFTVMRSRIDLGQTEQQFANALESDMRSKGAKGASFDPIVAAGPRSALPHARATSATLGESGFLLVDWGADVEHYKSDLTRVLVTGKIPPKLERIYRVVLKAQRAAIAAIRPQARCEDVDCAARSVIEEAGFGSRFGHGLGHGIGLDIHELPRFSRRSQEVLEPGMVVTVEPGIYLPGWGGVRIEDDVLVTKAGCEVLTHLPNDWEDAFAIPA